MLHANKRGVIFNALRVYVLSFTLSCVFHVNSHHHSSPVEDVVTDCVKTKASMNLKSEALSVAFGSHVPLVDPTSCS